MSEQAPSAHNEDAFESEENAQGKGAFVQKVPRWAWWATAALIIIGSFAAGLWSSQDSPTLDDRNGDPQVALLPPFTPTVIPTLAMIPTATPTTEPSPVLEPTIEQPASESPTPVVLPTVTPTPLPPPVAPRAVEIGGQANLRMQFANPNFQSSGRPLQIPIESRAYLLDGETQTVQDHWCIQMGLVNLDINLTLHLDPVTSNIQTEGSADLYYDFCDNRNEAVDSTAINLSVPPDARMQSTHNLFGERQLLNLSGLLDMDAGVIMELSVANLRPSR